MSDKSFKRHWRTIANLVVSAAALSYLWYRFGSAGLIHKLLAADLPTIVLATLFVTGPSLIHLARWRITLRQLGADIERVSGLGLLFIGYFFNQTLPFSVGGDIVRIWMAHRQGITLRASATSVLADRIAALLGLFALCIGLTPFIATIMGFETAISIGLGCILLLLAAGVFIMRGDYVLRILPSYGVLRHLLTIASGLKDIFGHPAPAARVLGLSAAIHFLNGFALYFVAKSIGVPIALIDCITLFPFLILATVLPISFAGWGVREGAAVVVFGLIGVSQQNALSVSVLLGIVMALNGIPGGIVWLVKMRSAARSGKQTNESVNTP